MHISNFAENHRILIFNGSNEILGSAVSYAGKMLKIGCVAEVLDLTSNFALSNFAENHRIFIFNGSNESFCSAESYAGKMLKIGCVSEVLDLTSNFTLF